MPKAFPRRVATLLLRWAIEIAPQDTLDWGQAMLSELGSVEGDWAALLWAIGGASVLAKHAVLSLVIPGRNRTAFPAGGDLSTKEVPMGKTALAAIGACAVATLLLFLAPAFRQAFRVSLAQWHTVLHVDSRNQPHRLELEALTRRAEQNRDAEGLAFVAARQWDARESARLAEEAVQLDPNLTWIYAVVAVGHPELPQIDPWILKLEHWDPQNALPYFITAESIDIDQVIREKIPKSVDDESSAWQDAMGAAFRSKRLDNYYDRLKELDRRVLFRYGHDDPYQAIRDECRLCLPSYTAWDSSRFAKSVLESGEILEARGDRKAALEKYWAVARFAQMMAPASGFAVSQNLREAYKRLGTLYEKEGKLEEAQLFAFLTERADQEQEKELSLMRSRFNGGEVSRWSAILVRASGLTMLLFAGLLVISGLGIARGVRSLRLSALRASKATAALGLAGAVGLLTSSALLYVCYRPYAEILQRFIRTGDDSRISDLSEFLAHAQIPLGAENFKHLPDFVFYFWFGVTALCMIAIVLLAVRHFWSHPRASATT